MTGRGRIVLAVAAGLLGAALGPGAVGAQVEATPELEGRVSRGGEVYGGAEVVLHRVSATQAGEIDTVRADPSGLFRFVLPTVPREDQEGDVYFASVRHDGILYFGRAVSRAIQLDSLYAIQAYDTVVAPPDGVDLPVGVRYVIAEESPTGWRITDLFEIAHEGDQTWVAAPDGGITWRHPLPSTARDHQVGGGDLSPDAAVVEEGMLRLSGPISPGARQFVLRYEVDGLDGLEIPLAPGTRVAEFLVREPAPDLEVSGLPGVETVEMQPGVTFRRYAAEEPAVAVIRVTASEPSSGLPVEWVAVGLALLLAMAGLYAVSRGGSGAVRVGAPVAGGAAVAGGPGPASTEDERNRLLLEVARIDERLEAGDVSDEERAALAARRADLVGRLTGRA